MRIWIDLAGPPQVLFFRPIAEAEGIRAVHPARDLGINFIYVSPYYGLTQAKTVLGRALAQRGNEVTVETWERWREAVERVGLGFAAAEQYRVFPPPPPGKGMGPAEAAKALRPLLEELRPEVVVSDILTLAPSLAAEAAGIPRATLVPHIWRPIAL